MIGIKKDELSEEDKEDKVPHELSYLACKSPVS